MKVGVDAVVSHVPEFTIQLLYLKSIRVQLYHLFSFLYLLYESQRETKPIYQEYFYIVLI